MNRRRTGPLRLGLHLEPGMRVGLFGGSFNPAHEGHAQAAATALRRLRLDRVIWLVSPQNPLKAPDQTASLARRMAQARRYALAPRMIVSDAEARLGSPYTAHTLAALKARYPRVRFVLVIGADNLAGLHRWRDWTGIMRAAPVAVVSRPGAALKALSSPAAHRFAAARRPAGQAPMLANARPPAWLYLTAPLNPASSTALRGEGQAAPQTGR